MFETAGFFANVAAASPHVQFVYNVAAGRVVFVNAAYERVLGGRRDRVNDELPGLLARIHPDDRAYLAHYWRLWQRGRARDEVEIRLLVPGEPDQWFCLTPYHEATDGGVLLGGTLRDTSVPQALPGKRRPVQQPQKRHAGNSVARLKRGLHHGAANCAIPG